MKQNKKISVSSVFKHTYVIKKNYYYCSCVRYTWTVEAYHYEKTMKKKHAENPVKSLDLTIIIILYSLTRESIMLVYCIHTTVNQIKQILPETLCLQWPWSCHQTSPFLSWHVYSSITTTSISSLSYTILILTTLCTKTQSDFSLPQLWVEK